MRKCKPCKPWLPDNCVIHVNNNHSIANLMRYARVYRDIGDKKLAFHYHDLAISVKLSNELINKAMGKV